MNVTLAEAVEQLPDLVRRAEAGEEIILTEHGHPIVKLVPARKSWSEMSPEERVAMLREIGAEGKRKALTGISSTDGQDALYDENGVLS